MSFPTVPIEEQVDADRRHIGGWIILGLILGLMIVLQLVNYFGRNPSATTDISQAVTNLRLSVGIKELSGAKSGGPIETKQTEKLALKDPDASVVYAASMVESGREPDAAHLRPLEISEDPTDQAYYHIYSQKKLTPEEAGSLAAKVPKSTFIGLLAAAHAKEKAGLPDARAGLKEGSGAVSLIIVMVVGCLALIVGGVLILIYVVNRSTGNLRMLGHPLDGITLPDADRLALRGAQYFIGFMAIPLMISPAIRSVGAKDLAEVILYLALIAMVVLLARVPVLGKVITLAKVGITKENLGKNILWGVCAAIANLPILLIVMAISTRVFAGLPRPEHPLTVDLASTTNVWLILKMIVAAAVFAPFLEEVMFRGTMLPAFSRLTRSPWLGGLITSLIFGAIHPTGIPAWPALAAVGGMSCFLTYQTRSLVPSIVMHAVHNFGTLIFALAFLGG